MDYALENLGPDRFQELCQAILSASFPRVQCFPLRQADGGRDAVVYPDADNFIAFQVKFIENPHRSDAIRRLETAIREDLPKAKRLVERGATAYYVMTNVQGTGVPDSGTIDKFKDLLENELEVPADCWWRTSINRKLDFNYEIRSSYPEIITGLDAVRVLIEDGQALLGRQQRFAIVKPFLRRQYTRDAEVKFKQGRLENDLLDLFIDVPMVPKSSDRPRSNSDYVPTQDHPDIGAATFLLNSDQLTGLARVVIEGAPGQGKSTLAQFLCQVHRMHFLGFERDIRRLPEHLRPRETSIPIRVELPQFATWLSKKDPFCSNARSSVPEGWTPSLEGFLAALIRTEAGGGTFTVEDVRALVTENPVLLVLDGLDEVSSRSRRRQVVEQICEGVDRLTLGAKKLNVVITSRPTAFFDSADFPKDSYPHFSLVSLSRQLIQDYTDKWIATKGLEDSQRTMVESVLNSQLRHQHMRELARNPMQLAILLSLIRLNGPSLPDKRTKLYDKYVEHYLERESEKSPTVQKHGSLLLDLHGHIAWYLHSESELGNSSGAVTLKQLKSIVSEYLSLIKDTTTRVEELFESVTDRVYFLESRVQGTYEFQVQPLKEYFAARHLYEFDPNPRREDRPDKKARFDAIARHQNWQNVARFYAGFCDRMELGTLLISLKELSHDGAFRSTNHPTNLTAMLLADRVFTPLPTCQTEAVSIILDGLNTGLLITQPAFQNVVSLPMDGGGKELVQQCFAELRKCPPSDMADELMDLIQVNCPEPVLYRQWLDELPHYAQGRLLLWFKYGLNLGTLTGLSESKVEGLLPPESETPEVLVHLYRAQQRGYIENSVERTKIVVGHILNDRQDLDWGHAPSTLLSFSQLLHPYLYATLYRQRQDVSPDISLWQLVSQRSGIFGPPPRRVLRGQPPTHLAPVTRVIRKCFEELQRPVHTWNSSLQPWDGVVEPLRETWGDCWRASIIATVASGMDFDVDYPSQLSLYDAGISLCARALYAKNQKSSMRWWKEQLTSIPSDQARLFTLLLLFVWADTRVIVSLAPSVAEMLDSLSSSDWPKLVKGIETCTAYLRPRITAHEFGRPEKLLYPRLLAVLYPRSGPDMERVMFDQCFATYSGEDLVVKRVRDEIAQRFVTDGVPQWHVALGVLKRDYGTQTEMPTNLSYYHGGVGKMPLEAADQVLSSARSFPRSLVAAAMDVYIRHASTKAVPIGLTAKKQRWFAVD